MTTEYRFHVVCKNGYRTHVQTDDEAAAQSWVRVLDAEAPHAIHSCPLRPHLVIDKQEATDDR